MTGGFFLLTWVIPSLDVVAVFPREPYIAGNEGRDVKCDIALVLVSRLIPFGSDFVHVHTRRRGAQITFKELKALKIVSQPDVPSLELLVEACESFATGATAERNRDESRDACQRRNDLVYGLLTIVRESVFGFPQTD